MRISKVLVWVPTSSEVTPPVNCTVSVGRRSWYFVSLCLAGVLAPSIFKTAVSKKPSPKSGLDKTALVTLRLKLTVTTAPAPLIVNTGLLAGEPVFHVTVPPVAVSP